MAADVAIHEPSKGGDGRNHHAHILLSACSVNPDGSLGKKAVALDPIACKRAKQPTLAEREREFWATTVNRMLASEGMAARVDHRSLLSQQAASKTMTSPKRPSWTARPLSTKAKRSPKPAAVANGCRAPSETTGPPSTDSRVIAHAERFEALRARRSRGALGPCGRASPARTSASGTPQRIGGALARCCPAIPTEAPRHDRATTNPQRRRAPLSREIALMLSESENPELATSACLRCAHSTTLTLLAGGGRPAAEGAGFSRVLRTDAPRHHDPRPAVLRIPVQLLTPKPGAAVQARAQRPAAHKAGASMPHRPPLGRSAGKGRQRLNALHVKHSRQAGGNHGRRPSGKNLEEIIEQMFKVARRALQSSNATPEQRSLSHAPPTP